MWVLSHSVVSDSVRNRLDCSPPGSSIHETSQATVLEWVAISFSRGSSPPRDRTCVSYISYIGRRILYRCPTWEKQDCPGGPVVKTAFPTVGLRVWSLFEELIPYMLCGTAKKKKKNYWYLSAISISTLNIESNYSVKINYLEKNWDLNPLGQLFSNILALTLLYTFKNCLGFKVFYVYVNYTYWYLLSHIIIQNWN